MRHLFVLFSVICFLIFVYNHVGTAHQRPRLKPIETHFPSDNHIFVFVMSGVDNVHKRRVIRDTGLMVNNNNVTTRFVTGRHKNIEEDVVVLDMVDKYSALPRKLKLAYEWGLLNTDASWFVKVDDDCFFNATVMAEELESFTSEKPVVLGSIHTNMDVHKSGKWAEHTYSLSKYPPFPIGSRGHIVNRKAAEIIVQNKDTLYDFQGEDVSVGIWGEAFHFLHINLPQKFTDKHNCRRDKWVCGHDFTLRDYKRVSGQ